MEKPLVSVVLCTYNGEKHLRQQIDSILSQTYRPFELIISDDASCDQTPVILKSYEADPRIKIFYQPENIGITANFAFAAAQTKGSLIAFSDQDDVWLPHKIEKLTASMNTFHLVYSDSLLVDEKGNSLHKKLSELRNMYSGEDSRCYIFSSCVWGHGMMVTRYLLDRSLPMPPDVHHDIWIAFLAFQEGGIHYLDEVLTYYRQHSGSYTDTLPQKQAARKMSRRYRDYQQQLNWINLMQEHETTAKQVFYQQLQKLYRQKGEGHYVFSLVSFMFRHRKELFRLTNKSVASQLVEILKQARGEHE